jgi:hypothetical protein
MAPLKNIPTPAVIQWQLDKKDPNFENQEKPKDITEFFSSLAVLDDSD